MFVKSFPNIVKLIFCVQPQLQQLQPGCLWGELELVWVAPEGLAGAGKEGALQLILPLSSNIKSCKVQVKGFCLDTDFILTTYLLYKQTLHHIWTLIFFTVPISDTKALLAWQLTPAVAMVAAHFHLGSEPRSQVKIPSRTVWRCLNY